MWPRSSSSVPASLPRSTDAGWKLPDTQANFIYLPIGERTDDVYLEMERRGVVTRPFTDEGLRVTISTPDENDRFLETLAVVMAL